MFCLFHSKHMSRRSYSRDRSRSYSRGRYYGYVACHHLSSVLHDILSTLAVKWFGESFLFGVRLLSALSLVWFGLLQEREGIKTEILVSSYTDRHFVMISQLGKMGTLVSASGLFFLCVCESAEWGMTECVHSCVLNAAQLDDGGAVGLTMKSYCAERVYNEKEMEEVLIQQLLLHERQGCGPIHDAVSGTSRVGPATHEQ